MLPKVQSTPPQGAISPLTCRPRCCSGAGRQGTSWKPVPSLNRYGFAAAFAFVIFFILFGMSLVQLRVTGAANDITDGPKKKKKKTPVLVRRTVPVEAK